MVAPVANDSANPFFLAEVLPADVLDLKAVLRGQTLGGRANLVAQRLGETSVIEQAEASGPQRRRHRLGMAEFRQRSGDDYAVKARKRSKNLVGVSFRNRYHDVTIMPDSVPTVEWAA